MYRPVQHWSYPSKESESLVTECFYFKITRIPCNNNQISICRIILIFTSAWGSPALGWNPRPTIFPSFTITHPTMGFGDVFPSACFASSTHILMYIASSSVAPWGRLLSTFGVGSSVTEIMGAIMSCVTPVLVECLGFAGLIWCSSQHMAVTGLAMEKDPWVWQKLEIRRKERGKKDLGGEVVPLYWDVEEKTADGLAPILNSCDDSAIVIEPFPRSTSKEVYQIPISPLPQMRAFVVILR